MTTPAKQTLREFEKAFEEKFGIESYQNMTGGKIPMIPYHDLILWAARWMAERCAKVIVKTQTKFLRENNDEWEYTSAELKTNLLNEIRQLAKELQ